MNSETQSSAIARFKTKPYNHQLECLNEYGMRKSFALLAEMGTGKSWIIINNMAALWSSHELGGAIIFAPNGVHVNWLLRELPKHMPDWVRWKAVAWSPNKTKAVERDLASLFESSDSTELRIMLMNWEALQTKRGLEYAMKFANSCNKLMLVADESTYIKNPAAARTKALLKLKRFSSYRRIMNGAPITNSPFDAFAQFNFLDKTILGTESYYAFKAEYAEMLQEGNKLLDHIKKKMAPHKRGLTPQVVEKDSRGRAKYKNLHKLQAIIAQHSFRVLKKDCLDLPKKIYKTAWFELTPEQAAIYKKVEKENRLILQGEETAVAKLAAIMKLAQITAGYYLHPDASEPVRIAGENPKLELLKERVLATVEQGHKVIVWARFRVEIEDIVSILSAAGMNVVQYHGGVNKNDRTISIDSFQEGEANVFVGQQQSGGTGITLTAANHVIYFSNTFSLHDRLQTEDRAHRIGQEEDVVYTNLIARNTIDATIVGALMNKKEIADIITGDTKDVLPF